MKTWKLFIVIFLQYIPVILAKHLNENKIDPGPGEPLFITPFLKQGKSQEAQVLARVDLANVLGFSGYFTVNEAYNSNIFFWFFPAAYNRDTAPVVLFLNGGPGASSMMGLFAEIGPYVIDENMNVGLRNTSWAFPFHLLFFDSPVGTGFSFTDSPKGYATTAEDVTNGLYSSMSQFFELFPVLTDQDLYLTGESYAGKYIPNLAVRIHNENLELGKNISRESTVGGPRSMNLKGIAVGDPFTAPEYQSDFGSVFYNLGFIDVNTRKVFEKHEDLIQQFISKGQYGEAYEEISYLLGFHYNPTEGLFYNVTGMKMIYNFLLTDEPAGYNSYGGFLNLNSTRRLIHVGSTPFVDPSLKVMLSLKHDILRPWKSSIETLLVNGFQVLIYNGQLDLIVAPILTNGLIENLQFPGIKEFLKTPKSIWRIGKEVVGYEKSFANLTHVFIRNAGHIVPFDQGTAAFDMIMKFTGMSTENKIVQFY